MKTLKLSLCLAVLSLGAMAQNNNYPTTGNPTIYEYSPTIFLQRNNSEGGYTQGIQTKLFDGTNNWFFGNLHDGQWMVAKGDYSSPKLSVSANGNVGIGTSGPLQKFVVSDDGGDGLEVYLRQPVGVVGLQAYNRTNSTYAKMQLDASQFAFTGGNLGIGLSSPDQRLTVNGNVRLVEQGMGYLINYASLSESHGGASTILGNNVVGGLTNNTIRKMANPNDAGSFVSLNYYYGITFHTGVNSGLGVDEPVIDSEKMRITQSGNVLIGKTAQANAAYKLDVNGKARANEIVVNTTGADFVFEDNYKLKPLAEVEQFIKQYKHLPEIASAQTMQNEGVGVSELQTKLLQKIEELTLHLIEKDKELSKEREVNQTQNERLKEIETLLRKLTQNK